MTSDSPTATNGGVAEPPEELRKIVSPGAAALSELMATFEDLQTVLRCCDRLMTALAASNAGEPDDVLIEGLWTMALLGYARCFRPGEKGVALTTEDLTATGLKGDLTNWHRVLLQLRDHYADRKTNPREQFSVGVARDADGSASGVAVTSVRQPLVDDVTVRQTGAIAFALSRQIDARISAQQEQIFAEVRSSSKDELDKLARFEVVHAGW
ncbi:hypothetical protein ACSMXN_04450 [Jatrophihabitans sp. DSM 45814]